MLNSPVKVSLKVIPPRRPDDIGLLLTAVIFKYRTFLEFSLSQIITRHVGTTTPLPYIL